ncbi:hypothetical protein [Campylobacter sp. RM16192]|uniref:hypothetical protein n=1 Tax=Campylobacter sp. RM16192 TaxID=1660080 RepID=UPI001599736C|nr:hypothetical protein [Campylobacter sp. RM16192]QKU36220.1 hypothetical protein CDOMC_a007 [Campylobacter sp. RM16192]
MKLIKFTATCLLALGFLSLNLNAKDTYDYTTDMAIANSIKHPHVLENDIKNLQKNVPLKTMKLIV